MKWDDASARSLRAEVCQIRSTREEMLLLFGTRTRAERCIVVPPLLAKRLAVGLDQLLREREAGLASPDATPAGRLQSTVEALDVPAPARPLFELVRGLNVGCGVERSFKMSEDGLYDDRLILGVRPKLAQPHALLALCRRLGMPQDHLSQFEQHLPQANTVGFGFEASDGGSFTKVYLEFWDALRARLQREPRNIAPALLFLGFKWDGAGSDRAAVARYTCYPLLSIRGIRQRLDALYQDHHAAASLEATRAILQAAAGRIERGDSFVYVEASEEGNPRRSFDLNFYKAGLRVADLRNPVEALSRSYAIPAGALERALSAAAPRPFGHLSGGLDRNGRDFLTVYYELEGL